MGIKNIVKTDVCILGAGAAGIALALKIPKNNKVTVVSNSSVGMNASAMAQGGIAAAISPGDHASAHAADSINVSATLENKGIVSSFVAGSVAEVGWLESQGVNFHKKTDGLFCLKREVGHGVSRVVHVKDETGKAIMTVLQKNVRAAANINMLYEHAVIDFVVSSEEIVAVKLLNILTREFVVIKAKCFVLATGGASGVFARHTNPCVSIGGGVAMAWRAGCSVANMEFQHFYPTCFNHVKMPSLLISGSLHSSVSLMYADGSKFMPAYDSEGEFLPRDIASRVLVDHKKITAQNVYMDVTGKSKKWLKNVCPTFYTICLSYGVDIAKSKVPVYPAAHYTCGGVVVDANGLTKFKNLYAVGEVAHTGLHGADRLCANGLMECMVFATKAAEHIGENISNFKIEDLGSEIADNKDDGFIFHDYHNYCYHVQTLMWEHVGIIRSNSGLLYAGRELVKIKAHVDAIYRMSPACHKVIELRNMVLTALIMTESAILRKESRGVHYNEDYPYASKAYDGVVTKLDASLVNFDEVYNCV